MIFLGIGILFLVLQDAILWWRIVYRFRDHSRSVYRIEKLPTISVFLAARNEQDNLPGCLQALDELRYPRDKITFYVGDDGSTDRSPEILSRWVQGKSQCKVRIFQDLVRPGQNGKARVLAELIKESNAAIYLFTDADCRVPRDWALEMVAAFRSEYGLCTGVTKVGDRHWFGRMQAIEWWLSLGIVKVVADFGVCLTAMGNNMLISAEAYRKVGGFEAVWTSVTEDLAISERLFQIGFRPIHHVSKACLVETNGIETFAGLMRQRKRWAKGAMSLSWYWVLLLACQMAFFPLILIGLFFFPLLSLSGWVIKITVQALFIRAFASKAETKISIFDLIFFESYYLFSSWATLLYYIWPSPVKWKNRSYGSWWLPFLGI
ncbi:glycosyltransferase family 2 protein [Lunatimonas salinarum]|uniref:glycosyltransferase family 2 protein n=1 Tax=Lunatimonas salinarum TaxID=1774590 RepID=UPI001ADF9502|nr:glycosyltransferase family 2 protein [Lunatimonas salinarum]